MEKEDMLNMQDVVNVPEQEVENSNKIIEEFEKAEQNLPEKKKDPKNFRVKALRAITALLVFAGGVKASYAENKTEMPIEDKRIEMQTRKLQEKLEVAKQHEENEQKFQPEAGNKISEGQSSYMIILDVKKDGTIMLRKNTGDTIELRPTSENGIYEYNILGEGTEAPDAAVHISPNNEIDFIYNYSEIDNMIKHAESLEPDTIDLINETPFSERNFSFYKQIMPDLEHGGTKDIDRKGYEWAEKNREVFEYNLVINPDAREILESWGGWVKDNIFYIGKKIFYVDDDTKEIRIEKKGEDKNNILITIIYKSGNETRLDCVDGAIHTTEEKGKEMEWKSLPDIRMPDYVLKIQHEKDVQEAFKKWDIKIEGNIISSGGKLIYLLDDTVKSMSIGGSGADKTLFYIKDEKKIVGFALVDGQITEKEVYSPEAEVRFTQEAPLEYSISRKAEKIIHGWGGEKKPRISRDMNLNLGQETIKVVDDTNLIERVDIREVGDGMVIITVNRKDGTQEVLICADGQLKNRAEIK